MAASRLRRADPSQRLAAARGRLERVVGALARARVSAIAMWRVRLERAVGRLEALSPLAVLGRGYALVYGEDGRLLRDAGEARVGGEVRARLARGSLKATVKESTE
jgi:exodeoxyribonuclease VII large subunit